MRKRAIPPGLLTGLQTRPPEQPRRLDLAMHFGRGGLVGLLRRQGLGRLHAALWPGRRAGVGPLTRAARR